MTKNSSIKASFTIKNTGKVKGKEIVQLYIQDPFASATRPVKELKGFKAIELEPGATQEVSFTLTESDLKFYSAKELGIEKDNTFLYVLGFILILGVGYYIYKVFFKKKKKFFDK